MSEQIKINFADGDTIEGCRIITCPMCGKEGNWVVSNSDETMEVEHIILWGQGQKRSRLPIIDGCFRQPGIRYIGRP